MLQTIANKLVVVVSNLLKLYNSALIFFGPQFDSKFHNWKRVAMLCTEDGIMSEMRFVLLHPSNTQYYYYFLNGSGHDYVTAMRSIGYSEVIEISSGTYELINLDGDLVINLISKIE